MNNKTGFAQGRSFPRPLTRNEMNLNADWCSFVHSCVWLWQGRTWLMFEERSVQKSRENWKRKLTIRYD